MKTIINILKYICIICLIMNLFAFIKGLNDESSSLILDDYYESKESSFIENSQEEETQGEVIKPKEKTQERISSEEINQEDNNIELQDGFFENSQEEIPKQFSDEYFNNLENYHEKNSFSMKLANIYLLFQVIGVMIAPLAGIIILFFRRYFDDNLKKQAKILIILSVLSYAIAGISSLTRRFAKPIIYIYPKDEQVVSVKLEKSDLITCSYPKYNDGWEVYAKPNGDLIDLETGNKLYSLYWEGRNFEIPNYKEGFIVKGEDSSTFLEEKLEVLGLNYKEKEEFIIYWLPKLEKNRYNFIKFVSKEDIDKQMPLEVSPKPDTIIRVYMQFKGLTKPMKNVKEQNLEKIERKGFVVVEWGGTEI